MDAIAPPPTIDLGAILRDTQVRDVLDALDRELVGLAPVKRRIREIAAFLVVTRARQGLGIEAEAPRSLHMSFTGNPGMRSRVAHHIEFPDDTPDELLAITGSVMAHQNYRLDDDDLATMREYIGHRISQPHFANARSMRNALDRAPLHQANRLFEAAMAGASTDANALKTITAADIHASRVFTQDAASGDR